MLKAQQTAVRGAIVVILGRRSGMTAREIAAELADGDRPVAKGKVNRILYANREVFSSEPTLPPVWSLLARPASGAGADDRTPPVVPQPGPWADSLKLYRWQVRALDGWAAHGYRGVVEAVTGAGKTRLALAAIEAEIRRGGRAVAIVPTKDLQRQWLAEIDTQLIIGAGLRATVGAMGGGRMDTLKSADIVVATVQTACQHPLRPTSTKGLLVADEAHHYGAEVWSSALRDGFDRRLGLTATYERDDDGVELILDPYFGPYRYSLGYEEALADDVIAHFKVAFIGVRFTPTELARYAQADDNARRKRSLLVGTFGLTPEPFGVFMREVQRLAKSDSEGARQAGLYLSAFSKRRQVLAEADAKFRYLADLAPAILAADRVILFSQTVQAAGRAVAVAEQAGIPGETLHAELDPSERRETFDAFRDGAIQFIAAPTLLDEGIDVPAADFAIVLASSRSRRQMIQRMGRVIRKKTDDRLGRIAILYVEGTSEDPTHGAHEDFVQFVIDAADDVQGFDSATDPSAVLDYLNDW